MRTQRSSNRRRAERGFTLPGITFIAIMLLASLVFIMRRGLTNQEAESKVQLRADYRQREDALVRALLSIVPNKAIGCMQQDSRNNTDNYTWDTIFTEAIAYSNGGEQLSAATLGQLNLASAKSSNSGDAALLTSELVLPLVNGAQHTVVAGNVKNATLITSSGFAGKLPPQLGGKSGVLDNDELYPIISRSKILTEDDPTGEYELAASKYPLYNRVRFPNIRFGFAAPGDYVVGKRNWWAFSVEFGSGSGLGTIKKNYVLSLYELPNQLPISASAATLVGSFGALDSLGASEKWDANKIKVKGSVFADRLSSAGAYDFDRLLGREELTLGAGTRVGGDSMTGNMDALGIRETMAVDAGSNLLPVAVSSNAGKVAFIALKRGNAFYSEAATKITNTISDTNWDDYTRGPNQCAMKVYITKMRDLTNQQPEQIEFHYVDGAGQPAIKTFTRQITELVVGETAPTFYWPYEGWAGSDKMPFQTEPGTATGRPGLTIYPERLAKWLASVNAAPLSINNSIYITTKPASDPLTIRPITTPTANGDGCVILRDPTDLTLYTSGLSIVTNMRLYMADDANQNPFSTPPPAGSGLPVADAFYPPFSIFAPEYRYGTTEAIRRVEIVGQVSSVQNTTGAVYNPLDFKSGADDVAHTDRINATLNTLKSPAELPPVVSMNWLLTVEEIH